MYWRIGIIILINQINDIVASVGDRSYFYQECLKKCLIFNCTKDGLDFKLPSYKQPLSLYLTQWTCEDECKYDCMWETVEMFHRYNLNTPQFYGKWPFIRMLGIQEPASAIFSLLNGLAHIYMIKKFRKEVRPKSPLIWLWHIFFIVGVNTWIWSAVFHTRDLPLTELLDYVCAFSLVLMNFYIMIVRLLRNKGPGFILIIITFLLMMFFFHHLNYLSSSFDYGYNMKLNILIGGVTVAGWLGWSIYNKPKKPHVRKCLIFVMLTSLVTLLEVMDSPPLLFIIDCHSLWHLSTAPLTILFYSFAIDDCKYLKKNEIEFVSKSYKIT